MAYVIYDFNEKAEGVANGVRVYYAQIDAQADLSAIQWMKPGSIAYDIGGVAYRKCPATGNWVMPALTPILITTQPADVETTAGAITESISVVCYAQDSTGAFTPTYQWYSNNSEDYASPTTEAGKTSATMALSTELSAGTYYYFCTITANSKTLDSAISTVTVAAAE